MKEKKIFIGLENTGGRIVDCVKCFQDMGYKTLSVLDWGGGKMLENSADIILEEQLPEWLKSRKAGLRKIADYYKSWIKYWVYQKAIQECEIFVFIWNSFKADFSDFADLKRRGKKLFFLLCGDDVRWHEAMTQDYTKYGLQPIEYPNTDFYYGINALKQRLQRLRMAEIYADGIFSRLEMGQLHIRPHHSFLPSFWPEFYPSPEANQRKAPVIVHAPSNSLVKGTKYVLAAFDQLKSDGLDFEPILIQNMKHSEAVVAYSKCDILVDQLIIPGSGKLSSEALYMNKVVVSRMAYNVYPENYPKDCPIVDAGPETIYQVLKDLILDHVKRQNLASQGRAYALKEAHANINCNEIIEMASGGTVPFTHHPTFFRNEFIPASKGDIQEYNFWNQKLKNCEWYSKYVEPGERSGLIF